MLHEVNNQANSNRGAFYLTYKKSLHVRDNAITIGYVFSTCHEAMV